MHRHTKPIIALLLLSSCLVYSSCNHGKDQSKAYLEDAQEAIRDARWDEAKVMAELALEDHEDHREAREILAHIHRGQAEVAREAGELSIAYQHHADAGAAEPSRMLRAKDYLAAVTLGMEIGRPADELAPLAEQSTMADPTSLSAHLLAAQLWEDTTEPERAIDHYLWAWAADPGQLQTGLRLGILYLGAQRFWDAAGVLGQILESDPQNVQAAVNRADALEQVRDPHGARQVYEDILTHYPDNSAILFRYAGFLERQGELRSSERMRDKARDTMPGVERRQLRELR
ncbi:MAG: tetratricopeptide repeat protein [Bradymonadaceae bacterium]|nr:tetratricopeptide repeat protein [Lujinxingiaceae bacterium]